MSHNYWTQFAARRLARRKLLGGTAAVGFSAAFLAACGSDDDDGGSATSASTTTTRTSSSTGTGSATGATGATGASGASGASGLITQPVDTTASAVRGGTLTFAATSGVDDFGTQTASAQTVLPFGNSMGKLFSQAPGYLKPPDGSMEGEIAEAIEYSPDGLTATIKLRPNLKWHPIEPVNGRALEADDIRRSWEVFQNENTTFRGEVMNELSPLGPVDSMEVVDDRTVVFKLSFPYRLEPLFAMAVSGGFWLVPKEYNDGYDARQKMIGLGPYYLAEFVPSSKFVYRKFDGYWDAKNYPLVDEIQLPIITEAAARLAQFETGAIYLQGSFDSVPSQDEVIGVKERHAEMELHQGPYDDVGLFLMFGYRHDDGTVSPFADVRVRQAFSMAIDRDLFIETFENAKGFRDAGLPWEGKWHETLGPGAYTGYWLDPQGPEFGENAKYFKHDVAEAKKLMEAAGYADGFDTVSNSTPQYRGSTEKQEVLAAMVAEAGIRSPEVKVRDYVTDYLPNIRLAKGTFKGWTLRGSALGLFPDVVSRLTSEYHSAGGYFTTIGFNKEGSEFGDPELDAMLEKLQRERDAEAQLEMIHDVSRYLGYWRFTDREPGTSAPFWTNWPGMANFNVFQGGHQHDAWYYWLDKTKAPFA